MPRAKRTPIEYTPQFGGGIFRSKETVAEELAELEDDECRRCGPLSSTDSEAMPPATATAGASRQPAKRPSERTVERTNGRTNERSNATGFAIRSISGRTSCSALSEIQAERFSQSGRKPKLGELVQEALDAYIAKERKRTNGRTERTMI